MDKKFLEDATRFTKAAQRADIYHCIDKLAERVHKLDSVLFSKEYSNIANAAYGERFTRLQKAWFKAFKKQCTLVAAETLLLEKSKDFHN